MRSSPDSRECSFELDDVAKATIPCYSEYTRDGTLLALYCETHLFATKICQQESWTPAQYHLVHWNGIDNIQPYDDRLSVVKIQHRLWATNKRHNLISNSLMTVIIEHLSVEDCWHVLHCQS